MCLIAIAWGTSAQFPLVIAANRDEWYARPTAPLAQWTAGASHVAASQPNISHSNLEHTITTTTTTIIGGRDLQDGGTWMGFSPSGRFAMLTNVRNPATAMPPQPRSRGHVVVDWLSSHATAGDWAAERDFATYAGFNLIIGDWSNQQLHYLTNQVQTHAQTQSQTQSLAQRQDRSQSKQAVPSPAANAKPQALQPGHIVGLSNAALNTPWPKTTRLTAALCHALGVAQANPAERFISTGPADSTGVSVPVARTAAGELTARLQHILQDRQPAPDAALPHTGVTLAQEKMLSSIMVRSPTYGTRTSLVAVLDQHGTLHLQETTHAVLPSAAAATQRSLSIEWPAMC